MIKIGIQQMRSKKLLIFLVTCIIYITGISIISLAHNQHILHPDLCSIHSSILNINKKGNK